MVRKNNFTGVLQPNDKPNPLKTPNMDENRIMCMWCLSNLS